MLVGFIRALGQLTDSRLTRILVRVIVLSMLVFVALGVGLAFLLEWDVLTETPGVKQAMAWLGGIAVIVATFFLFPVVVSVMLGFYLEAIAAVVEARHYPGLPAAKGLGLITGTWASLRFLLKALIVNLLVLFALLIPALYPFVWLVANGYLLGREYFELVALRRLSLGEARGLRRSHRFSTMFGGLLGTLMFLIPVVNLLAPVILTMAMVHALERWRTKA